MVQTQSGAFEVCENEVGGAGESVVLLRTALQRQCHNGFEALQLSDVLQKQTVQGYEVTFVQSGLRLARLRESAFQTLRVVTWMVQCGEVNVVITVEGQ